MPIDSSRLGRSAVAFAGVALVWVSADAPRQIVAAVGGQTLAQHRAERVRLEEDYRLVEERRRFTLRLTHSLTAEGESLRHAAVVMESTQPPDSQVALGVRRRYPDATPTGRWAANLIELTANELHADPPRRRQVVNRLLAEYRREYGDHPPPLRELEDRVSRGDGVALAAVTAGDSGN